MASTKQDRRANRSRFTKMCVDIFAGTIAGINVTLVGHPFDTLKVRLQTQPTDKPIYSGVVDCFKKTMKWEGFGGLYKGVSSPLAGQMFFRANCFLAFGEAKRFFSKDGKKELSFADVYKAGAFAWFVGAFAECPIDFFKTQMQIQIIKAKTIEGYKPEYTNMADCVRKVVKLNGIAGAYQGLVPHLMRNIPAGSVHLGTFESLRMIKAKKEGKTVKELPASYSLFAGSVGGFLFWFLFFPFDVMKSSMQADAIKKSERKYRNVGDCFTQLKAEGLPRFYRGFSPCLMRALPANAVLLLTSSYISENL